MKLIHLSDLHIGKRVNGFSMLEDQAFILDSIISIVSQEAPDAVIIAGDVYDRAVPNAEAVQTLDGFLYRLSQLSVQVFIISGNHDSAERLSFGSRLMDASGIHISPVYSGRAEPVVMHDSYGEVGIYMLPYICPSEVREYYPDECIDSFNDAVRIAVNGMDVPSDRRNILVAHQFVTGASQSGSEDISVGGTDNVDSSVFDVFDYTALGHIHSAQNVGGERVRYCGTPLKYSFSEVRQDKTVTVAELHEKGRLTVSTIPLIPMRDMREISGSYAQITAREFYAETETDDYIRVTLTDEEDIPDAIGKLRAIYPNIMRLDYDNTRTRSGAAELVGSAEVRSPSELFEELYTAQNGKEMTEEQRGFLDKMIEKIWGEQ